jgi:aminoglycoside phosphotransferase (APT) family kinase protein
VPDAADVRVLLRRQAPALADRPLARVAEGFDNHVWRVGEHHALRLPRHAAAVALLRNEQEWLPRLAQGLPLRVPVPVVRGRPEPGVFPWEWSVVPWLPGDLAAADPPAAGEAVTLARFLAALHRPAPAAAPANPVRGVPLAAREGSVRAWHRELCARPGAPADLLDGVRDVFDDALGADVSRERVWLHGDLHPRNVLVERGAITAVLDWGDLCAGDRATDLAAVWLLFDAAAHAAFWAAYAAAGYPTDADTTRRARGWAAFFAFAFARMGEHGDAGAATLASRVVQRLVDGAEGDGTR